MKRRKNESGLDRKKTVQIKLEYIVEKQLDYLTGLQLVTQSLLFLV